MESLKDLIKVWEAQGRLGKLNNKEEEFLRGLRTALRLVSKNV